MKVLAVIPGAESMLAGHWRRTQMDSLSDLGVEVSYLAQGRRREIGALARLGRTVRAEVAEQRVDIVHVHWGSSLGLTVSLAAPVPVIVSFCGSDVYGAYNESGSKTFRGMLSRFLSKLTSMMATCTIAKSQELRDELPRRAQARCFVIPNGVDLDHFSPMPRAHARHMLGWSHETPVALFCGGHGRWVKDPHLARAAFQKVQDLGIDAKFHVVENEPHDKMPLFYNASDVLLVTSRHEGSSNSVKEALACNLPVVSTPCGDTEQLLDGVRPSHVTERSADGIADRLCEFLRSPKRSNGRLAVKRLDLPVIAADVLRVYDQLVDGSHFKVF